MEKNTKRENVQNYLSFFYSKTPSLSHQESFFQTSQAAYSIAITDDVHLTDENRFELYLKIVLEGNLESILLNELEMYYSAFVISSINDEKGFRVLMVIDLEKNYDENRYNR
ncbi:hypothetical protein [Bartonella queenslandensis]|uniref:hypothetical protein n=1 Tax=Bartonella queenslandensis TaxID=481138 RepID=UPI001BA9C58E|nr:hypothetical protein [Bartonella queenslandensis]